MDGSAEGRRLLFVIPALSDGGAQKQCIYLLNELQKQPEWDLHLVRFHSGVHDDQLRLDRLTVHDLPVASNYDLRALIRLIALSRRLQPDIIMSWLLAADVYSYFVRLAVPRLRWLMTERNSAYPNEMRFRLRRILGRNADAIVANSTAGETYWQQIGGSARRYVVSNILRPVPQRTTHRDGPSRAIYVGRLEPQKNVVPLARAACALAERAGNFEFVFVGEGSERDAMTSIIATSGVSDRVRLVGFQRNVDAQLRDADVLVSLSKHEGMPNAMMEGIAARLPVVASEIPEHVALLGTNYPYYVRNPHAPEEVASVICAALSLDASRHLDHGLTILSQLTPDSVARKYEDIFYSLLGTQRAS